ncbi:MAG: dephospho-CoA kinase [Desulforhopalus sp.]
MIIAVTGGLGTGKSTVSKILAAVLEAELIDTDQLCRKQMLPGARGYETFRRTYGARFVQGDGTIDRQLLRKAVFDDRHLREKLEGILHPIVQRQVVACGREYSGLGKTLIVEVPLLYEVGWQDQFDVCVVVFVPEKLCLLRVMERAGMSVEEVRQIMDAQIPISEKVEKTRFVVDNSGTFVSTVQQITWLSKQLGRQKRDRFDC